MNKEWFSAQEAADLIGLSKAGLIKKSTRENWHSRPRKGRGGGKEYHIDSLPPETKKHLLLQQAKAELAEIKTAKAPKQATKFTYNRDSLWAVFARKPQKQKDIAQAKLAAMHQVVTLLQNGISKTEAFELVANQTKDDLHHWSALTLKGFYYGKPGKPGLVKYERCDWLAALVASYTGRKEEHIDPVVWEDFKADYLRLEQPNVAMCYDNLKRKAAVNGWKIPSQRTFNRRVDKMDIAIKTLKREGRDALRQLFPHQERTVRDMHAMQRINGDGYMHNVFVKFPDGEIRRPKTWYWQDVYSRKIVGYRIDKTENTETIRLSFGDVVEKYGIPQEVTIDNTRAAANKTMTGGQKTRYRFKVKEDDQVGVFGLFGITVTWTSVSESGKGNGRAKPIERAFGKGGLGDYIDKQSAFSGAYTGANPMAKPDNYGETAVPLAEFAKVVASQINAWNDREGRRSEMAAGIKSYNQVFEESYANTVPVKPTSEQRHLFLLASEPVRVDRSGGISTQAGSATGLRKNRYTADELLQYRNTKVVVRFDPADLFKPIQVYTLDGRHICEAELAEAAAFGDTTAAREYQRQLNRKVKATKEAAKAEVTMTALEHARTMPYQDDPDPVKTKSVQGVFNKTLKVSNGVNVETDEPEIKPSSLLIVPNKQEEVYESRFIEAMKNLNKP